MLSAVALFLIDGGINQQHNSSAIQHAAFHVSVNFSLVLIENVHAVLCHNARIFAVQLEHKVFFRKSA